MEKSEDDLGECGECLGLKKKLTTGPKIVLWSTLVATKNNLQKSTDKKKAETKKNGAQDKGHIRPLVYGIILGLMGVTGLIWKPYDVLMAERLEMRRGLPPYELWKDPPDEVLLSVYLFNITNSEEFTNGTHEKMHLQEIGPIVYREKLTHDDVTFHENGTMTYKATRRAIYLPELNTVNLEDVITVPNFAVLGMSSYLWNAPWTMKFAFNMIVNRVKSKPFLQTRIIDYLWNFTDPVVPLAQMLAPHLVPTTNMGILQQVYGNFQDSVTVYMGRKSGGEKFFKVNRFNGLPGLGLWENSTCDSVEGSTEGVAYHQPVQKTDVLKYLRKTFCRVAPLYFTGEHEMMGLEAYKFELPADTFDHPDDGNDCYLKAGLPALPSGLTDASPCYHNFPIATSFPHFMYANESVTDMFDGLKPDYEKHSSYVYVEPNTGVPFTSAARSQSNLVIRPYTSGFHQLRRFGGLNIPMFWLEYKQVGLPWNIKFLMYFSVKIVPYLQYFFIVLELMGSLYFLKKGIWIYLQKDESAREEVIYSSLNKLNMNTEAVIKDP